VSLRYFNAAGADESGEIGEIHDPEPQLIPVTLRAMVGRRPPLEVFGSAYPTPEDTCIPVYVHLNDLAEAHVAGLRYLSHTGASTATGKGPSVKEIITTVEKVTGVRVPHSMGPRRPGDRPALVADPSRARGILGWKAQRSLEQTAEAAHR